MESRLLTNDSEPVKTTERTAPSRRTQQQLLLDADDTLWGSVATALDLAAAINTGVRMGRSRQRRRRLSKQDVTPPELADDDSGGRECTRPDRLAIGPRATGASRAPSTYPTRKTVESYPKSWAASGRDLEISEPA